MGMCPICNGLSNEAYICPSCSGQLRDCGKTVDYLDDYSAYMDQQLLEKVDGLSHEESNTYCLHLFYCAQCQKEYEMKIDFI
ncbi:MAG: hypothetical protein ACE3JP_09035 [Ectobacillus sp.]